MKSETVANRVGEVKHMIGPLMRIIGFVGLMMLGAACGGSGGNSEITVEELTGTWRAIEFRTRIQFDADGTYRNYFLGEGPDSPVEVGQYTLEETLLTFITGDEGRFCATGQRGIYELERTEEGEIRMVLQEDECSLRETPSITLKPVP